MKVAHYVPNEFHTLFTQYIDDIEFVTNECPKDTDIIFCGSTSKLQEAFVAAQRMSPRVPLYCWVWDIPYNWREWGGSIYDNPNPINFDGTVNNAVSMLKHCTGVLCGSAYTRDILKFRYNIDASYIPFYLDTIMHYKILNSHTKDQPNKLLTVSQISRFAPHKRFEVGIEAMDDGMFMNCIGLSGVNNHYYDTLIKKYGDKDNIKFLPNVDDETKIKTLIDSDILITASVFEGWGMSPVEAMYCEVPVIVPDLPVFRKAYHDDVIYFNPDDLKDLHSKILSVSLNRERTAEYVKKGREIVKNYTPEKFAKNWRQVLGI